jgi:hypothetical protein
MFFLHIQGATTGARAWNSECWRLMDQWKKGLSLSIIDHLYQRHDKVNPKIVNWTELKKREADL